ncbi:LOW QUALITY PROTEIN: hypothetical protein M8C21_012559, partial [Ambrosia artemisiifolia]
KMKINAKFDKAHDVWPQLTEFVESFDLSMSICAILKRLVLVVNERNAQSLRPFNKRSDMLTLCLRTFLNGWFSTLFLFLLAIMKGGQWNSRGKCDNEVVEPIKNKTYLSPYLDKMVLEWFYESNSLETLKPFSRSWKSNFVDLFRSHPKLTSFDIHGAMFATLCHKNTLKNASSITNYLVNSSFVIPCLEEVVITVSSPLNAEQKICTLEALVKFGMLRKMKIKILQMRSGHSV